MLDSTQIEARQIIAEAIGTLIVKVQKKAEKERARIKKASVTYKGDVYKTENEILEAYACDCFTQSVCDKLLEKLDLARGKSDPYCYTDSELLVIELQKLKNEFLQEIAFDKDMKERQKRTDERMLELTSQGYSIREAETIIGNEERMRFE